ncbi:MAG TPA: hypothetical protein DDZ39_08230 [Flavobacteriaceae bacterium]|jgi:hypothetical protein|nr:hypothetical protein [Flavobacteriaceae bacterium]
MNTDFTKLKNTEHLFRWFSENPFQEILETVEDMYKSKDPNMKLEGFTAVSEPQWLTTSKNPGDASLPTRTAVAFECEFELKDTDELTNIKGVLSWVAFDLETNPGTKMWINRNGTLKEFGSNEGLRHKIYFDRELKQ